MMENIETPVLGIPTAVIFDIDGTVANISHRRHYVRDGNKNWGAFNNTMHLDTVYPDVLWLYNVIRQTGVTMLFASGRGEEQRQVTVDWLSDNGFVYERLYMRPARDYRPDHIIKAEILEKMRADGFDPTMAFDDRNQVVSFWRSAGLRCLQLADGNF
jgi:hypothetical protein